MKRIIIIMVTVILLILSFLSINKKMIQPMVANKKYEKQQAQYKDELFDIIEENVKRKEEELKKIQEEEYVSISLPKTEEEICRTVIGTYFHHINSEKYENAYDMLDEKFKSNYFDTLSKFKEYCQNKYSSYKILEYIKYERRNDYILVKIIVKTLTNNDEQEEMQINIAEKGNNVYTISFGIEG